MTNDDRICARDRSLPGQERMSFGTVVPASDLRTAICSFQCLKSYDSNSLWKNRFRQISVLALWRWTILSGLFSTAAQSNGPNLKFPTAGDWREIESKS